jgi:hypothetical protein
MLLVLRLSADPSAFFRIRNASSRKSLLAVRQTSALKTPAALEPRDLFAGGGEMGALMQGTDWAVAHSAAAAFAPAPSKGAVTSSTNLP